MVYQMKKVFIINFTVTVKKFGINKSIAKIGKHIDISHTIERKIEHEAQINEHIAAYTTVKLQKMEWYHRIIIIFILIYLLVYLNFLP